MSGERNSRPPDTGQGYRDPVAHDATATYTLAIIGGGNMGEALLGGLIDSGWAPAERIAVVEISAARRAVLSDRYPGIRVTDQVPACEAALIAVKPGDAPAAVTAAVSGGARRILSIAAGVTVAALEAAAGSGVAVLRSMPNTPALVRAGPPRCRPVRTPPRPMWCGPSRCCRPSGPWYASPKPNSMPSPG